MNSQRFFGILMLVGGVILLIIGMNASDSMADQMNKAFSGRFTERTTWYIIGGIALAAVGLLVALFAGRRRRLA